MNMRERMARAMWAKNRERCAVLGVEAGEPWDGETEALKEDWLAFADAGLETMDEPTDLMRSHGQWAISDNLTVSACVENAVTAERVWRRMLATARSEK